MAAQAEATSKDKVLGMLDQGLSVRETARALDLSTQRIYQILQETGTPAPTKRGNNGQGED